MYADLCGILFTEAQIKERVRELGRQISEDYAGEEVYLVGILKGAVIFYADIARAIAAPVHMDFMAISSYGASTESSGVVRIMKDLDSDVTGRHVLVVEDIVDSGLTLSFIKDNMLSRGVASVKLCTLLDKPERRRVDIEVDYHGFRIPDAFVVGYGLDYAQRYRNLPDIGILKPEIYTNVR